MDDRTWNPNADQQALTVTDRRAQDQRSQGRQDLGGPIRSRVAHRDGAGGIADRLAQGGGYLDGLGQAGIKDDDHVTGGQVPGDVSEDVPVPALGAGENVGQVVGMHPRRR